MGPPIHAASYPDSKVSLGYDEVGHPSIDLWLHQNLTDVNSCPPDRQHPCSLDLNSPSCTESHVNVQQEIDRGPQADLNSTPRLTDDYELLPQAGLTLFLELSGSLSTVS